MNMFDNPPDDTLRWFREQRNRLAAQALDLEVSLAQAREQIGELTKRVSLLERQLEVTEKEPAA